MTLQRLTQMERELLQRYFDGETQADERSQAEALLEQSAGARIFVEALEELAGAVRMADEAAWDMASPPTPEMLVQISAASKTFGELELDDLAPMLERFYDGEVDGVEAAVVAALIDERDDVADYLATLDSLGQGINVAGEDIAGGVDFSSFWENIETGLDANIGPGERSTPSPRGEGVAFDADEHQVLLYRFHDNEVSEQERAQVEAWIANAQPQVLDILAAQAELHLAVNAGMELAQEQVDLRDIWDGVERALNEEFQTPEGVVSLAGERTRRSEGKARWHSQGPVLAIAAAIGLIFMGAMFGSQIFKTEQIVIKERTVVIVDSVEYAPGASVMINSPAEFVSSKANDEAGEEEMPTVIWLFDDEETNSDKEQQHFNGPI